MEKAKTGDNKEDIDSKIQELLKVSASLMELSKNSAHSNDSKEQQNQSDDVVDAEFEEVDGEK